MDHDRTLRYLDEVQARGIKLGLDTMYRLLEEMGDPQRAFPAVVVGGTNGKGSVAALLASILRSAGHRTGLYTSPHLVRYEERFVVDGRPVSPDELALAVTRVKDHVDRAMAKGSLGNHPTHFEILTAAAFDHFRRAGVEVGVLEVGMGGRLDAVATARTVVAVITNVSLEHTKHLGDTVEQIAREKAGIIRDGCWLVTAETRPETLAVIRREAAGRGVHLVERHAHALVAPAPGASSGRFGLTTRRSSYGEVMVPLAGRHQVENATLAVLAAEALEEATDLAVPPAAVVEGLARAHWPGRLQVVSNDPLVLLDGAHNPAGCEALSRALKDLGETGVCRRLCLVFGVLDDKEVEPMARSLFPLAARLILTRGGSERFRDPTELAVIAGRMGIEAEVIPDLAGALERARGGCGPGDAVCLAGSLYLVGDAMRVMGIDPYR